jgi:hypothetical protein
MSLVTDFLAARRLPVTVSAGRIDVYTECEPSRKPVMLNLDPPHRRVCGPGHNRYGFRAARPAVWPVMPAST